MSMHGDVHVWFMSPEELAAYKEKHPIKATKPTKGSSFVTRTDLDGMKRKKGTAARWGSTGYSSK